MALPTINGISLCAGAGGLDLGVSIAEPRYRSVVFVERDAYAAATLVARMGDQALEPAPVWDDLRTFDGRPWAGAVDLLLAGYPCQPFSTAGKRRGADDPRHLWPEVRRIIGEAGPRRVFLENVTGHLHLGFDQVARDLQGMGRQVLAGLFGAAEVGASHFRARLFILADAPGEPPWELADPGDREPPEVRPGGKPARDRRRRARPHGPAAAAGRTGRRSGAAPAEISLWPWGPLELGEWRAGAVDALGCQPAVPRMDDGLADRVERRALTGNGVVPLAAAHAWRTLSAAARQGDPGGIYTVPRL